MSETTVLGLTPNKESECLSEFRNSHGFEPTIWRALGEKYLHKFSIMDIGEVTSLWKNGKLPEHHRACLLMTFDKHYVKKEHYARAALDIRKFLVDFPKQENCVNHLSEIADIFESNPNFHAIGFHCSLIDNLFDGDYNEETDSYIPPKWETLCDVYEGVDKISNKIKDNTAP